MSCEIPSAELDLPSQYFVDDLSKAKYLVHRKLARFKSLHDLPVIVSRTRAGITACHDSMKRRAKSKHSCIAIGASHENATSILRIASG